MSEARTNQGGSVVSFVVVGIVLVALAAGGIYLLKHRAGDSSSHVAKTSMSPSPVSSGSVSPNSSSVAPSPQPSSTPSPSPSSKPSASPSPTIPKTGPSDLLPSGLVAATVIGSLVAFIQSRRARQQLLNQ